MKLKSVYASALLFVFSIGVCSHLFVQHDTCKPDKGTVLVKEKKSSVDQVYVATEAYCIFIEPPVQYAPAKDVKVTSPSKLVDATANSPPGIA